MPYSQEFASGDSLIALEKSKSLRDFEGTIRIRSDEDPRDPPPVVEIERSDWLPKRVVAIDGSNVTHRVQNGFPGAEATLVMLSVVFIDISKLAAIKKDDIPSPAVFTDMETASSLDAVLPGSNIVRENMPDDTPKEYFRSTVFDTLDGTLDVNHESLLDTMRAITEGRNSSIKCPIEGCRHKESISISKEIKHCPCENRAPLYETDSFRFQERFNELGSNGEVHGEVRHVIEVLSLVNILRYFEHDDRIHYLKDSAFVLDGPLAVFGQPAWIAPYVRNEILRISEKSRRKNGCDLLLIGVEKSGQYVTHFDAIDWTDDGAEKSKFPSGTVIIPDAKYINRNIVFRPENAKPSGVDTYFGRKVFYKTKSGAHAVINAAIVNDQGADFHNNTAIAFPRLGDSLNILDHLSTYLYEDGFMPLVRAHAHAAIPLKRGTEILSSLFD